MKHHESDTITTARNGNWRKAIRVMQCKHCSKRIRGIPAAMASHVRLEHQDICQAKKAAKLKAEANGTLVSTKLVKRSYTKSGTFSKQPGKMPAHVRQRLLADLRLSKEEKGKARLLNAVFPGGEPQFHLNHCPNCGCPVAAMHTALEVAQRLTNQ